MSDAWEFCMRGQPPTLNHAYKNATFRRDGNTIRGRVLTDEAKTYVHDAVLVIRSARPSGWHWKGGQIRVRFRFYLKRDQDCTNSFKVLEDALKIAIGVDDCWFLPCAELKVSGVPPRDVRTEVTIESL